MQKADAQMNPLPAIVIGALQRGPDCSELAVEAVAIHLAAAADSKIGESFHRAGLIGLGNG
jgi:hypothetical protein